MQHVCLALPYVEGFPTKRASDSDPNTCAANFDNLQTVPKSNIGDRIARLLREK